MRRSRLTLIALLTLVAAVVAPPSVATGPGGWERVGPDASATNPDLNAKVSALLSLPAVGALAVGGTFTDAGGREMADRIAYVVDRSSDWRPFNPYGPSFTSDSVPAEVKAIAFSDGKLYVGGVFQNAGGNADADFLAAWDAGSQSWVAPCVSHAPGPAFGGNVDALQIIGGTLYVGGEFQNGAGMPSADYLVACDLATGVTSSTVDADGDMAGPVYALTADSNGVLYAGGGFNNVDQIPAADHVAAYDGAWHAMGSGPSVDPGAVDDFVRSLTASGTDVYVGTDAVNIAGIPNADHVARWDGSAWSALGSNGAGTNGWFPAVSYIYAVQTYTSSTDSLVIAAGSFQNADGRPAADMIAYFDGTTWRPLGSDGAGGGPINGEIHALSIYRRRVFAGGNFTTAGGDTGARFLASYELSLPDAMISNLASSSYAGNGLYNDTGAGQTRTVRIRKGSAKNVFVKIQNDGLIPGAISVDAIGNATGIHASYFRTSTGKNITTAVRNGTYSPTLAARGSYTIRMRIAVGNASPASARLRLRSWTNASFRSEVVKVIVKTYQ